MNWLEILAFLSNIGAALVVFMIGILFGMVLISLPSRCACQVALHLPRKAVSWWHYCFRGIIWTLYRRNANAVVLQSIEECAPFLSLHFSSGGDGEIWLYNNDLTVFADDGLFSSLYAQAVFPIKTISAVKIVFDKRCQDNLMRVNKDAWGLIRNRLTDRGYHGGRAKIIKYLFLQESDAEICNEMFKKFVSEEAYVFYTRDATLRGTDSLCVYRRYDGAMDAANEDRVILLAKRCGYPHDPLCIFMPDAIVTKFTQIFAESTRWKDFVNLATELAK